MRRLWPLLFLLLIVTPAVAQIGGSSITNVPSTGSGGSGSGTVSSGTVNQIPKYTAATTVGDSTCSDDGTTVTCTAASGITAPIFTSSGAATVSQFNAGINSCTAGSGSDAYTCTLTALTSYNTGACYTFKADVANTGGATFTPNTGTLAAKTLVKPFGSTTTALETGDILANQMVTGCYDGTNIVIMSNLGQLTSTAMANGIEGRDVSRFHMRDDFMVQGVTSGQIGEGRWTVTNVGSTTYTAGVAGHPGILRLDTSAGAELSTALTAIRLVSAAAGFVPTDQFDSVWIIRPVSTVAAADNFVFRFGFCDTNGANNQLANAYFIEKAASGDTTVKGGVANSSATTSATGTFAISTNTWFAARIAGIQTGTVTFSAGATVAAMTQFACVNSGGTGGCTAATMPSVAMNPCFSVWNNNNASSKQVDFDYFDWTITGLSR